MKNETKKLIAMILLASFFFLLLPKPTYAIVGWGEAIEAALLKESLEEIYKKIQDTIVATLKTAAIRMIMSQLNSILGSGKPGVGPIGDWRQFIYGSANQYSMQVTNDFFRSMSSGTPSALGQRIVMPAQNAVIYNSNPSLYSTIKPDLQNYVSEGRADLIFQPGYAQNPWVAWNQAAAPQNSMADIYLRGLATQQTAYNQQAGAKTAEGIAGAGFQSKTSGGNKTTGEGGQISLPGSAQKDLIMKAQTMSFDRVSMAQTIPDVVAAMVTQVITQMLNQGLRVVTTQINQQLRGTIAAPLGGIVGSAGSTIIRGGSSAIQGAIQQGLK